MEKLTDMVLHISQSRTLKETQDEFNNAYPYLRIEFYRNSEPGLARRHLKNFMPMTAAGLKQNGELEIYDQMTVGQLENAFKERFGLNVQLSRRSGTLWLETTMTDNWTLKQQNDHGRELSEPAQSRRIASEDESDDD
ncbi:MAG: hypothetical protein JNN00_13860 [Chitinophagaceae bacterium]|nr:hypothetical protein [Chitinophagaceae bacterium]